VLAGSDFFTAEVLSWSGLVTYFVLFFIELESRRVWIGGITRHPESGWMQQVARNATLEGEGDLKRVPLRAARSRQEVLHGLLPDARGWWGKVCGPSGAKSGPERFRRALGALSEERVPFEVDSFRRRLVAPRA
jgi:hypothetical protein